MLRIRRAKWSGKSWAILLVLALATSLYAVFAGAQPASATLGTNDYPYRNDNWCQTWTGMNNTPPTTPSPSNCTAQYADSWGFYKKECVSFVAWRLNNDNGVSFYNNMKGPNGVTGHWGSAYQWKDNAAAIGYAHTTTPAIGSVAWWPKNTNGAGSAGHVAYVDTVNYSGTTVTSIVVEEYNAQASPYDHGYRTRTITPTGGYWPSEFIHVKDIPGGSVSQSTPDDPKGNFEAMTQVRAGARLTGWSLDPNTTNAVEIDAYEGACCANPRGAYTANLSRPDVGAAFPGSGDNHGFDITMSLPAGLSGSKTYCLYAINQGAGGNTSLGCRTVTFNWNPIGNYENLRRAPGGVHLSGWTLDYDTSNSLETDVYEGSCCANPRGAFTANTTRPDVGAAFPGSGDNHGFEIGIAAAPSSPTNKTYCAYGINVGPYGNSSPQLGCRTITVDPNVTGNYEDAWAISGGAHLHGWVIDPDTASAAEVDIYEGACCANPVGAFTANVIRPDVGMAWLDYGDTHGFEIDVSLSAGSHTLCAYGINVSGTAGSNKDLGCKTVTVS